MEQLHNWEKEDQKFPWWRANQWATRSWVMGRWQEGFNEGTRMAGKKAQQLQSPCQSCCCSMAQCWFLGIVLPPAPILSGTTVYNPTDNGFCLVHNAQVLPLNSPASWPGHAPDSWTFSCNVELGDHSPPYILPQGSSSGLHPSCYS